MQRRQFLASLSATAVMAMPLVHLTKNYERPLKLFYNGYDSVVHYSLKEAIAAYMKECGITKLEAEGDGWQCIPDTAEISWEEDLDEPQIENGRKVYSHYRKGTAKEFCEEFGLSYERR